MSGSDFDPTELQDVLTEMKTQDTTVPYPFVDDSIFRSFYILHLLKKNKSGCYLKTHPMNKYRSHLVATGKRLKTEKNIQVTQLIKEAYPNCKKMKKVLIVPLKIIPEESKIAHENVLIFNTALNEVERFEPHGSHTDTKYVHSIRLNTSIEKFVKGLELGLAYIPSHEVQIKTNWLQKIEKRTPRTSRRYKTNTILVNSNSLHAESNRCLLF